MLVITLLALQWSCQKDAASPENEQHITISAQPGADPNAKQSGATAAYAMSPKMCGTYVWLRGNGTYTVFNKFDLVVLTQGTPPGALVVHFEYLCVKFSNVPPGSASGAWNNAWNAAIDFVTVKLNNGTISLDAAEIKGAMLHYIGQYCVNLGIFIFTNEGGCTGVSGNPPPQTPGFCR